MGKNNKKGSKANVFKVAGAKSLKKSKAKAVNLGLKNIKQKVQDIDKEFMEINNKPKAKPNVPKEKPREKKETPKPVTKEDVSKVAEAVIGMDL